MRDKIRDKNQAKATGPGCYGKFALKPDKNQIKDLK